MSLFTSVLSVPPPFLPPSPLYSLESTPTAGRTLTSALPIPPHTFLLSSGPAHVSTVVRKYKKDVCAQCLKWDESERGLKHAWKDTEGRKVRWFCGRECAEVWEREMGERGAQVVLAGERIIELSEKEGRERERKEEKRRTNGESITQGDAVGSGILILAPVPLSDLDISASWEHTISLSSHLLLLRLQLSQSPTDKSLARKLRQCSPPPLDPDQNDLDVVQFLTDGIARRFAFDDQPPGRLKWDERLRGLVPSLEMYRDDDTAAGRQGEGRRNLESHLRIYTQFIRELPFDVLLPSSIDVESSANDDDDELKSHAAGFNLACTILSILSRDCGNSFGMRDGDAPVSLSLAPPLPSSSEKRGPLIAYGIFPPASLFNHSCAPNVLRTRSSGSGSGSGWTFTSGDEEVGKGTELCISYLGGEEASGGMGRRERRELLKEGWGFWCACERCGREED